MSTTPSTDPLAAAMGSSRAVAPPTPAELAPHLPDLEILALIGQGGMGAVYRVRRHSDGAFFALKVVRPGPGQEAAFAARFVREAEALERLHHPHIVAIHGHGSAGPWCWLLMDLVDGANLREIVATGRLSPAQTLALVPPLCAALQYAHDQGVIHRDLKPENILLDTAGVPHLVDFGLAKLCDNATGSGLTNSGAAMGTVHYMAPEQVASAKGVDHRADIYALGVVIYELLTGQLPLGRFESPSQRVQVDVRIDEVVLKALERDPEQRWQQMRQVGKAVADVKASPTPNRRWQLVNRAGVTALALYVILAVCAMGFASTDTTWIFVILAALAVTQVAWLVATLLHQGRTRMLWLALGLLVGLGATSIVVASLRSSAAEQLQESERRIRHLEREARRQAAEATKPLKQAADPVVAGSEVFTDTERAALQARLGERVTLEYKGVKIHEMLIPLFGVSGFNYVICDQALLDRTIPSLHLVDVTVEDALRVIIAAANVRLTCSAPNIIQSWDASGAAHRGAVAVPPAAARQMARP